LARQVGWDSQQSDFNYAGGQVIGLATIILIPMGGEYAKTVSATAGLNSAASLLDDAFGSATNGTGKTPVIGKMSDLNNISKNEYRIADLLPDQGSPQANWNQNSSVLRSIMNEGNPIRDASPYPMDNAGFLGAERNLLQNHGWRYSNGYWFPPTGGGK
jgi:hypothetical protein